MPVTGLKVEIVTFTLIVPCGPDDRLTSDVCKSAAPKSYHWYKSMKPPSWEGRSRRKSFFPHYGRKQCSLSFSPDADFYIYQKYWLKGLVILAHSQVYSGSFLIRFGYTAHGQGKVWLQSPHALHFIISWGIRQGNCCFFVSPSPWVCFFFFSGFETCMEQMCKNDWKKCNGFTEMSSS